jgi:hypothetical protein
MARANRRISEPRNGIEQKVLVTFPLGHQHGTSLVNTLANSEGIHRKMG